MMKTNPSQGVGAAGTRLLDELRTQYQRYRDAFELAPDGYLLTDPSGKIREANRAAAEMLSTEVHLLSGTPLVDFVPEEDQHAFRQLLSDVREESGIREIESSLRGRERKPFEAVLRVGVMRGPRNEVIGFRWTVRDVTKRKRSRHVLRSELNFMNTVLDTVRALVVVLDAEGRVVRCNRACEEVSGYSEEELRRGTVWRFLVPDEADGVRAVFKELTAGQFPNTHENWWVGRDGSRRRVVWHNSCVLGADGSVRWVIATGIDVTEQRRAEELIRQGREELRSLTARLLTAEEEERRRLARELHDDLNQRVAALAFDASCSGADPAVPDEEIRERFRDLSIRISGLADTIRTVAQELHPSRLEDLGLATALRAYCEEFSSRHGLALTFGRRGRLSSVPHEIGSCLYRIAQEALVNAAKHSRSSRAAVRVLGAPNGYALFVRDFGVGFDPDIVRSRRTGLGIVSMEERARLVGGVLRVKSAPGGGSLVRVWIPEGRNDVEKAPHTLGR